MNNISIHEDGTLEVKVPNAQKVGRVLVVDTDSHIGGGLFYPDEAEQIVIRSRTLMPTKDFKEWAKRVREENPNVIVIPCDAEVVSADAIYGWIPLSYDDYGLVTDFPHERDGEWVIVTDGNTISVERIKKDAYDHFFPNGRWFELEDVIAWMPLPKLYKGGDDE